MPEIPRCFSCKHYIFQGSRPDKLICKVFQDGIPIEILFNKFDHKNPYPGDNGIQFEPKEEAKQK